jgi:SAM-dependent methyltransferase
MNFVRSNLCDNEENNEFLFLKKSFLRSDETMYNIFKCAKCKVSFADQEQIDKIDLQKIYDEYFSDEKHKKKLENPNANRKYWLKQSNIGCNAGHFLYFLKGNWEKHGVELSQYAANIAKNKNLERFNGYIEDAKYSSDYFDVITSYAVIEHVEYPSELLDAIKRVLKHNGLCVIMTGDKDSIKAKF